jgi:hypothetical protein
MSEWCKSTIRRSRLRSRKRHIRIISPSSDSICLVLVILAAHDFTDAYHTDETLSNVEVFIP